MRARLLDMGEVSAVRSQSIYHAVAAAMGPGDSPVAILLRPASRLVSIGVDRHAVDQIDLALCLEHRIPVIRGFAAGPPRVIDRNRLLVSCAFPTGTAEGLDTIADGPVVEACRALGLAVRLGSSGEILAGENGESSPRAVGSVRIGTLERASCLVADLAVEPALPLPEGMLVPGAVRVPASSLTDELGEPPESAAVAEAVVKAFESSFALELLPSMPTPDEMEAIYEWDERLVLDPETMAGAQPRPSDQLVC